MLPSRWLLVSAVAVAVLVGSCSSATAQCNAGTCDGCCTESGACESGTDRAACGFGGGLCRSCAATDVCTSGVCVAPSAGGGGGSDGGADDGGSGGGAGGGGGGGAPQGACAGTLIACGSTCVDHLADPSNCGGCGRVCGQGQVCNRGTCETLPADCTAAANGCGPGLSCDPATKTCTGGCRLVTDCPLGATCSAPTCACPTGQHACGQVCVPDDALASCGTRCQACVVPAGGTVACMNGQCTSECGPGFADDAGVCADVDECQASPAPCSPQAICTNTVGGFSCACGPGFTGDGGVCADVDECLTGNGGCHPSAACTNTDGGRTCACNPGFTGDGGVCADVNECLTGNGGCASNATCANTDGGRTCTCPTGYMGNGVTCTDINECATNNGGCSANATCTNTPGSRTCACNQGYTGNGVTCTQQKAGEACAVAQPITPPAVNGNTTLLSQTTVGFTNDMATTCAGASTVGPDRVYSFALPAGRQLRVSITVGLPQWDPVLYFVASPFTNCRATGTACLASSDVSGGETASYRNNTGSTQTIYVVVDSKSAGVSGTYSAFFYLDL